MQRPAGYLMPTLLITKSYTFYFPVKTGNLLILFTALFQLLQSPLAFWEYWNTCVVESDVSIAKVLLIFSFAPLESNYKFG